MASSPPPRGWWACWLFPPWSRLASGARTRGFGSPQPPRTWSCIQRRRSDRCPFAPRSWTSILISPGVLILAAAGVHLEVGVLLQLPDLDEGGSIDEGEPLLGTAIGAALPRGGDERLQGVRRRAGAGRGAGGRAGLRVEAEGPPPLGREAA